MAARKQPRTYRNLGAFLEATGLTHRAVAQAVGSTQATITRIASGARVPRPNLARRLSQYCSIPLDSFLTTYLEARDSRRRSDATTKSPRRAAPAPPAAAHGR